MRRHACRDTGAVALSRTACHRPFDRSRATATRLLQFNSDRMQHDINGREFDTSRIGETVKFGDIEVWTFVNDSQFPHPVDMQ